ncbi:MAG: radical SAM protein, partial [Candidatus Omnitrophica bacterium]|nr:radical SAM protein [Candidatus Omnitrophota bacterium]
KTLAQLLVRSDLPEKYQLTWRGQALARGDMDAGYLKLLKASGCCSLTYGVESLSDKVLLAMHKNITVADIESVLKATRAAGIVPQINLIVGYPGEGEKEFQETIENLKRFGQYIDRVSSFSMLTMTYGSPLFRKAWRSKGTQEVMEWHRRWVLEEDPDNTFEVRDERFKRLQTVVEGLGLPTLAAQHYEDAFAQAQQELAKPPTGNSGENCECG